MRAVSARPNPAVVRVWQDGSPAPRAAERGAVGAELGRVAAAGALAPELLVPAQLLPPQRGRLQCVHVREGDAIALPDVPLCPDCGMDYYDYCYWSWNSRRRRVHKMTSLLLQPEFMLEGPAMARSHSGVDATDCVWRAIVRAHRD